MSEFPECFHRKSGNQNSGAESSSLTTCALRVQAKPALQQASEKDPILTLSQPPLNHTDSGGRGCKTTHSLRPKKKPHPKTRTIQSYLLNFCSSYQSFSAIGKWDTYKVLTWIYSYTSQKLRTLILPELATGPQ